MNIDKLLRKVKCFVTPKSKLVKAIFHNYLVSMDQGKDVARRFIVDHKDLIEQTLGRQVLKEFILNYRSHFSYARKQKLLHDFEDVILTKTAHHKSDLAIAHNIIKNCSLTAAEERVLLDYVYERIRGDVAWSKALDEHPELDSLKRKMIRGWSDSTCEILRRR